MMLIGKTLSNTRSLLEERMVGNPLELKYLRTLEGHLVEMKRYFRDKDVEFDKCHMHLSMVMQRLFASLILH